MYDPQNCEETTREKCLKCGKFVSLEDGFYDRAEREEGELTHDGLLK